MAFLELDQVKSHLRLELGDTAEDEDLLGLIDAAARACELRTGRWIDPGDAPEGSATAPFSDADLALLRRAALLMIGDWFAHREGDGAAEETISRLLRPLEDFSDR